MGTKQFIFNHCGFQYGVNVMDVVEIVAVRGIAPFHGELYGCCGYMSHRDLLIPILDVTAVTDGIKTASDPTLVVILNHDGVTFALTLDEYVSVGSFDDFDGTEDADSTSGDVNRRGELTSSAVGSDYVECIRGYRGTTLVILAVSEFAGSVKARIGDQRNDSERTRTGEATKSVTAEESSGSVYMCARIDQCLFAIDVADVLELIEEVDVTPLFKMPPAVRGLINLRGQVLACVDISTKLGFSPRVLGEQSQFIVMQCDDSDMALCVDRVSGIRQLPASAFRESDTVLAGEVSEYLSGIFEEDDRRTYLLNIRAVFDSPDLQPYRNVDG